MAREVLHLVNGDHVVILGVDGSLPELLHIGNRSEGLAPPLLFDEVVPPGSLDQPAHPTIVTEPARGWFGEPGLMVSRDGKALSPHFTSGGVSSGAKQATFTFVDATSEFSLAINVTLEDYGIVVLSAAVTNTAAEILNVESLCLTVPMPAHFDQLTLFGGRHAMEFCEERISWGRSVVTCASRRGRTSHQQAPTVFCAESSSHENSGSVWGIHLAWSGNFKMVCDAVNGDQRTVTAGELLVPGETRLAAGETYSTPKLLIAASVRGYTEASKAFHSHLRSISPQSKLPRPVIVNTWEAVYFAHDIEKLFELARRSARVGAERFVLDDGWFLNRRDDTAGLGDWEIDSNIWPQGLTPLAEHVRGLGMQFGIWVEPEMVNPNSNLYREHPDWVLGEPHQHELTGRNQLVLDLSRAEVRDHLTKSLSNLLESLPINHVKWDHNRDLVTNDVHAQSQGLYEILESLREIHPEVEFESCASGGGRVDAGIAEHVVRFWTSDSIDALDRLSIQRGALRVFPPEMLGAHIGAPVCHTTGRHHPLSFRALSAMPFWLGIEWDLLAASEHELERLAEVVGVHKKFRDLFHSGTTVFSDHPDPNVHIHSVIATDRSEGIAIIALKDNGPRHINAPARIFGLDSSAEYRCEALSLGAPRWALNRGLPTWVESGLTATGAQLANIGLPFPPLLPASGILVRMVRIS